MESRPGRIASNLIRKYFSAYELKDRKAIEELVSDDLRFSSPFDDHINRRSYFERCWPFSEKVRAFHILKLFEEGNEAFVLYECVPKDKPSFRNTEFFKIEDGKIKEVQVFFGAFPENSPQE